LNRVQGAILAALVGTGVIAAIFAIVVLADGGSVDVGSADEVSQKVADAIREPGMVYHAKGTDGSLAWIDAENQRYRARDSVLRGSGISVGGGWSVTSYDPATNSVSEEDTTPQAMDRPRIDDPMVRWLEPLAALAFGDELTVSREERSPEGPEVIVLNASTRIVDSTGAETGTLHGIIEIDAATFLPHAFEQTTVFASGVTATPPVAGLDPRVVYTSEFIERSALATDFFERSVVEAEVKTNETELAKIRSFLGLTPYWFGEEFDGGEYGNLQLPPSLSVDVDEDERAAAVRYALVSDTGAAMDAVIVRIVADVVDLEPPLIPEFAPPLPEREEAVMLADGTPATLYTSILTIDALPCPSGNCPSSEAPLYRRLVFERGETAVQIEASPKIDGVGTDMNGFNSDEGIVALAEALVGALG